MSEIPREQGPDKQFAKENQWEDIFREAGEVFPEIQVDMPMIVELFKKEGLRNVLDLGCGAGRHSLYLAERGFIVSGIDGSPSGIEVTKSRLESEKLQGNFKVGDIYEKLPYPDNSFQAIVSTQKDGLAEEFADFYPEIWEESNGWHYCLLGKLKKK